MTTGARGRRSTARLPGADRGVAIIEFAIGFVFLGVIVFGAIDLGRAFITWNQVKNAAREGAVFAERDPWSQSASGSACANPDNIVYRAQTEGGSRRTDLVVTTTKNGTAYSGCQTPSSFTITPGDHIEVSVSAPFTPLSPLGSALFGSPTIRADVEVVVQ
ncbi:MAG: TadE/TadG family type IV pilus assembly protein [Actinomycetota bacterium]